MNREHKINPHQFNDAYSTKHACDFSPETPNTTFRTLSRACADPTGTTTTKETQLTTRELSSTTTVATLDNILALSCSKRNTNIKLTNIQTVEDIQNLINFIDNPSNELLLKRIEAISFGTIAATNEKSILVLLNYLTEKADALPMLSSLSFDSIYGPSFELPSLPISITFLSFQALYGKVTFLDLPANLISLSFEYIDELTFTDLLSFPTTLRSLHLGIITRYPFRLPQLPDSLTSFSYKVEIRYSTTDDKALKQQLEALKAEVDARNQAASNDQV